MSPVSEETLQSGKIRVQVKSILMELVPAYLKRRDEDVRTLISKLESGDFLTIQTVGHKLCGNASTYGFHEISRIGSQIEAAAKCHEVSKIEALTRDLMSYLKRLEVVSC
jgi:HPt (histidine-containing phosphotransfer) domain-containing protein